MYCASINIISYSQKKICEKTGHIHDGTFCMGGKLRGDRISVLCPFRTSLTVVDSGSTFSCCFPLRTCGRWQMSLAMPLPQRKVSKFSRPLLASLATCSFRSVPRSGTTSTWTGTIFCGRGNVAFRFPLVCFTCPVPFHAATWRPRACWSPCASCRSEGY
jgi:hypothetical protein